MAMASSYYLDDGRGNVTGLTDSSGNVTDSYQYDAFGNQRSVSGTTKNPFRFGGQVGYYFDEDTGDYYVRARNYSPIDARWLSEDPIGYDSKDPNGYDSQESSGHTTIMDVNPYRYVENSPTNRIDPSGLFSYGYVEAMCTCKGQSRAKIKTYCGSYHSWPVKHAIIIADMQNVCSACCRIWPCNGTDSNLESCLIIGMNSLPDFGCITFGA